MIQHLHKSVYDSAVFHRVLLDIEFAANTTVYANQFITENDLNSILKLSDSKYT